MQKLDSIINHGICLKDVKEDDYSADDWTELTVKRLFDWGLIQAVWDYGKSCIAVEEIILSMEKYFDESMVRSAVPVYKIQLDYTYPIDTFVQVATAGLN